MIDWWWLPITIFGTLLIGLPAGFFLGMIYTEDFLTMKHIADTVPPDQITFFTKD